MGGFPAWLAWVLLRIRKKFGLPQGSSIKLRPRQAKYPVIARLAGSSDIDVFNQIFFEEEYRCLLDMAAPRVILDLGANVGYSSAYFLSAFPQAKVVAVEPDSTNFEVCGENLASYGARAQVVLGGVWSRCCQLEVARGEYRDGREWTTQVREVNGTALGPTVEAWDIPSLMALAGANPVDLLKIDIERSEIELFGSKAETWLPKVRNICIELHGPDCSEVFFRALEPFDYDLSTSGELTICRNLTLRSALR